MQPVIFRINSEIESRHWWFRARRRILLELIETVLPPSPENIVVDVGCGTGGNIGALSERYRCIGIDPSQEAVALARRRFPKVQFCRGYAPGDLPRIARQARVFLLTDVLEHAADDDALLASLVDYAAPGSHFMITVPADMSLWSEHDEVHGHYRRYDAGQFSQVWRGLPVEPLLLSHFNARLYALVKCVRVLRRCLPWRLGPSGTDLGMPPAWINRFLERIFSGESAKLRSALSPERTGGYSFGVSLVAMLRKSQGATIAQGRGGTPALSQDRLGNRPAA